MKILIRTFEDKVHTIECTDFTFRANNVTNVLKLKTDEGEISIERVKVFTLVH